jgi:peptide/nickel transport system substrate-binding protein
MKLGKLVLILVLQQFILVSAQSQTLRIGILEDPDILDPTTARLFSSSLVLGLLCDRLFVVSQAGQIEPQLATGYHWSEDFRTITLDLRRGVRFHDGEPFNAEAVKYNIERSLTLPGSTAKSFLGPISSVAAIDEHSVTIEFSSPFPGLLAALLSRPGMMVSPKSAKANGDAFGKRPVCAGPFAFVERVPQDRIVVDRFRDYWNKDSIFVDRVVVRPIPDSTVRFANLQSGDLDLIERMAASDYAELPKYPKLKGAAVGGFSYFYVYLIFNVGNGTRAQTPLGRDARIREAFELAVDRVTINEIVYSGQHTPTNQWLAPDDPYYVQRMPIPKRDVAKARELLTAAGVSHPKVELMTINAPEYRQLGELLQAMTGEAGFELNVRPTEAATAYQSTRKGEFEAFLTGFLGRGDPDTYIYPTLACDGPYNEGHFCDPKVDQLLFEARSHYAPDERKRLYEGAAAIILRDRPNIYLVARRFLFGHTAKLSGFRPIPGGSIHLQGVKLN